MVQTNTSHPGLSAVFCVRNSALRACALGGFQKKSEPSKKIATHRREQKHDAKIVRRSRNIGA